MIILLTNILMPLSSNSMRRSNAQLEAELNEIYGLIVAGASNREIMNLRNIKERNFRKYVEKLHQKIIGEAMARRQEYFIQDIEITKSRLLQDKRILSDIIHSDATNNRDKLEAIQTDIQLNLTLMRLEYEGSLYSHGLSSRQATEGQQAANITPVQLSTVSTS